MLHKSGESIWAEIKHSISNILMLMGVLSNNICLIFYGIYHQSWKDIITKLIIHKNHGLTNYSKVPHQKVLKITSDCNKWGFPAIRLLIIFDLCKPLHYYRRGTLTNIYDGAFGENN